MNFRGERMRFILTKKKPIIILAFFIAIIAFIIIFVPFAQEKKLGQFLYDFNGTVIRRNNIGNIYNKDERLFYYTSKKLHWELGQLDNRIPWGISKKEVKRMKQERKLLDESPSRLVFGPYKDSFFVEYHFNEKGQLFKVVETSGLKYTHVEDNHNLAEKYRNIVSKDVFFKESYALFDSLSTEKTSDINCETTLFWIDEYGNENSDIIKTWTSPTGGIFSATGKDEPEIYVPSDYFSFILDNDYRIERCDTGKESTNVTFFQEIRKVNNEIVLGEMTLTNVLLAE